jgi:cyanophycinase-like exopeptidase
MNKKILFFLFPVFVFGQGYTSYFTGNPTNITTNPNSGFCLMGGASEHDNAMIWLLQKANGGDIVVLRSSGSNGYNDYLYSGLGVNVNSVETLVITSATGAVNPYVLDKVAKAEMIWFAGGDQWNYVSYFKNNALEDLINNHINVKHAPIGGTSAGMAILGSHYFSAQVSSVTSATALNNPYAPGVTIGSNDFISIPVLQNTITDTHFDNPDRKGRLSAFLARMATDQGIRSYGIAANEYVAVCIDENGKAKVYGDYPDYDEFAYFLQANCQDNFVPETCLSGSPLTWNKNGEAIKVYKVPGTMNGTNSFELSDWKTGSGGNWENWKVINGSFSSVSGTVPNCTLSLEGFSDGKISVYPVPFSNQINFEGFENAFVTISDTAGKIIFQKHVSKNELIETSGFASGTYIVSIATEGKKSVQKIIKN